jgi:hypothetical protein
MAAKASRPFRVKSIWLLQQRKSIFNYRPSACIKEHVKGFAHLKFTAKQLSGAIY